MYALSPSVVVVGLSGDCGDSDSSGSASDSSRGGVP